MKRKTNQNSVFCFVCSLFCVNIAIINVWGCPCEAGQHVWILKCVAVSQIKLICVLDEPKTSAKARLQLLFVCVRLSANRMAHGRQRQARHDLLHHKSEITPLKSTQHFKHTPTHAQTHVQSQTPSCPLSELWELTENFSKQCLRKEQWKEKNWAPDSPGSSWSGHTSFTMNSKSP